MIKTYAARVAHFAHVPGPDRDGPDEDPRSRANDERGREEREDRKGAHYRKSSG